MCFVLQFLFYVSIGLALSLGAASWMWVKHYSQLVAEKFDLEREWANVHMADDAGTSSFERRMAREIMSKEYLNFDGELRLVGERARNLLISAAASSVIVLALTGIFQFSCNHY